MSKKTIVVIGGTSGIGSAILERLSDEGAGVLHLSRSETLPAELPGVRHLHFDAVSGEFPRKRCPNDWTASYIVPAASGCDLFPG